MRRQSYHKHVAVFLLSLNLLILFYYLLHAPHSSERDHYRVPEKRLSLSRSRITSFEGKPWPNLPSYVPWHPISNPKPFSCEAYFGNGFTRPFQLLKPQASRRTKTLDADLRFGGTLECYYSETLGTSICEARRIVMHPERISMSMGGENISKVLGRSEDAEMPRYTPGSFEMDLPYGVNANESGEVVSSEMVEQLIPRSTLEVHPMKSLFHSLRLIPSADRICSRWIEEPTLFITRFEYANLFHTFTDWYSAYVTARVADLPRRPHVVFIDGHCKSPMEETWQALFSSFKFAKHFTGPTCFRHALLTPIGYETALFKGLSENIPCHGCSVDEMKQNSDDSTARLLEFGEMVRAAFGLLASENKFPTSSSHHRILFVRRENYLAHPRHGGKVESRLSNEEEVFQALQSWARNYTGCGVTVVNGLFAHMSMRDQVEAIQAASVIVGAHGAGLTHIIAARPGTVVLEIVSSYFRRPHFALISKWRGLKYHSIHLEGSTAVCSEVVETLHGIMEVLGC